MKSTFLVYCSIFTFRYSKIITYLEIYFNTISFELIFFTFIFLKINNEHGLNIFLFLCMYTLNSLM